jgi:hypothetical protein
MASNNQERRDALRNINNKKKSFLRQRAETNFAHAAMRAPRLNVQKQNGVIFPLKINEEYSFDSSAWEKEFRTAYAKLFGDELNNLQAQDERLAALRTNLAGEPLLSVPVFLLNEVLARARRKSKSCPGSDGICWLALTLLPWKARVCLATIFEHRLNGSEAHQGVFDAWCNIVISLIPKIKKPELVSQWRPIALTSCLQKLYLGIVTKLIDQHSTTISPQQCGFRESHQTAEVSESVRQAVQKAACWGTDLYILKADVFRAFDSMAHSAILESMVESKVPVRLQHATLQELAHCTVSLLFQGNEWKHIPFEKGGRQGGTDTPHIWIRLLDLAVRRSRVRWKDENLGVEYCSSLLEPFVLDCLIWADDMVMCASSFENIKRMFCIDGGNYAYWPFMETFVS